MKNKIILGWAHSEQEGHKNFGDELSPYIIKSLSGMDVFYVPVLVSYLQLLMLILKRIFFFKFKEVFVLGRILFGYKYLLSTGSILQFYKFGGAYVWGSGLISKTSVAGKRNKYLAVRGPKTRELLLKTDQKIPEVYGDPALILKKIYNVEMEQKFEIGFVPHVIHFDRFIKNNKFGSDVTVIDLRTDKVKDVIDEIRSCKLILSSSLHGLIVAHTYNVPAVWVQIDDEKLMGDNLKFEDYFLSLNMQPYEAENINVERIDLLIDNIKLKYADVLCPDPKIVEFRANNMLAVAPFKKVI